MEVVMLYNVLDKHETVRTTVTLPANLLHRSQELVDSGRVPNRNALIVAALEQFIADLDRAEIDRQFAALAEDVGYQALQAEVEQSFVEADWEALAEAEQILS